MADDTWDALSTALGQTPEAQVSPSLATGVIQAATSDPSQTPVNHAHTLAGAALVNAADQVKQTHKNKGWFGQLTDAVDHATSGVWNHVPGHTYVDDAASTVAHEATSGLGDLTHYANMPLATMQHIYRSYHYQVVKHGVGYALGGFLSDPAQALRNDKEAWFASANTTVSPGRDLAAAFGLKQGDTGYGTLSGTGDAGFDLVDDPLLALGKLSTAITGTTRAVNGAEDIWRLKAGTEGVSAATPAFAPIRRAVTDIANTNSAARIVENYPQLANIGDKATGETLAAQLAKAKTTDQVWQHLADSAATQEFMNGGGTAPVLSLTKKYTVRAVNDAAKRVQVGSGNLSALDQIVTDPTIIAGGHSALRKATSQAGRFVNLFTNHAPTILNTEGDGIVVNAVHPFDPKAPQALNSILRYTQSPAVANAVSDAFRAEPDIGKRSDIWANAVVAMAHGAGITDQAILARGKQDIDGWSFKVGSGKNVNYGMTHDGKPLSGFLNDAGNRVTGPLFTTQGGNYVIPAYGDVMSASRSLSKWRHLYGQSDDFAYKFTANIFKPGNLFSLGFPIRTAINEMTTQILGAGGMKTVHAAAANALAHMASGAVRASGLKAGVHYSAEDAQSIIGAMFHSADPSWVVKVARNDKYLSTLMDFYARHPGTWDPAFALAQAGHNVRQVVGDGDITGNMADNTARNLFPGNDAFRFGKDWTDYTRDSGLEVLGNATAGHAQTLAKEAGAQVQAKAYRQSLAQGFDHDQAEIDATLAGYKWITETPEGQQAAKFLKRGNGVAAADVTSADPNMAWAQARAQAIRGVTTNLEGEHLPHILDGIADGNMKTLRPDALKAKGLQGLPAHVPGLTILPKNLTSTMGRIVQFGFDRVIMPTMQTLAREPIFLQKYVEERQAAEALGQLHGLTADEMAHVAATRAATKMIPEIHNLADKSQFAVLARNYIPFFFAREQAYRRLTRAVQANPFGFRKIQLAAHGLKDIGFINTDPQSGQESFTYPMSGELGRWLPQTLSTFGVHTAVGIPSDFTGNVASLASGGDVPGYEAASAGWSPFVSIPLRGVAHLFPELKAPIDASIGSVGMSQPAWEQIIPNSAVRNLIHTGEGESNASFANAMADAIQFQIAHGNLPPGGDMSAPGAQKWLDQIRTNTRIIFATKALFGIGAPASPILKMGDTTISPKVQAYLQQYGLADGMQRFITDNPNDTAYTVFKSTSKSGVSIPETQAAVDWAKAHEDFINDNGKVGLLFLPQSTTPDPNALSAYKQEVASGLRMVKSPEKFAQDIMVQSGWNEYEAQKKTLDAYVAANPDNTDGITQAKHNFYTWANTELAASAPAWFADYNSSNIRDGNRKLNAQALVTLYQNGQEPADSPMSPLIGQLVTQYQNYQASYPNADQLGTTQTAMKADWNAYLDDVLKAQPTLATVISNAFRGL